MDLGSSTRNATLNNFEFIPNRILTSLLSHSINVNQVIKDYIRGQKTINGIPLDQILDMNQRYYPNDNYNDFMEDKEHLMDMYKIILNYDSDNMYTQTLSKNPRLFTEHLKKIMNITNPGGHLNMLF